MPDTIAERAKLDLTRRCRILELVSTQEASGDRPARYSYLVEFEQGGKHTAPSVHEMRRGDKCVLRRYQVRAPFGSRVRNVAPWVVLDPEDADPTLPPENYGRPVPPGS